MNCMPAALSLLLSTCLVSVHAQTAPEQPVKPHILIETVGPDGWRARLGPTNVATMLASEEGRAVWQPQLEPLLGFWKMMVGDEEAFAAASKRIFDYSGTIRIAVLIEPRSAANVVVALEDDGRSDLQAIAKDITDLVTKGVPGEWQQREVDGQQLKVRTMGPDAITAPIMTPGRLFLIAGGTDTLDKGMGLVKHLTDRPAVITKPKPGSPALQITFDVPALLTIGDRNKEAVAVSKALGFHQLETVTMSVRAAGPHVELDYDVALNGKAHGLVAAFCPDSQGVSGLSQLVPGKASAWKVGRFDFPAMVEGIVSALESDEFFGAGDIRKEINESCGLDIWKELLPHMTDEVLVVGSPFGDFDRASEATWTLAFRVKDDAAFDKAMLTVMKNAKPLFSVSETVDVDGVKLRRYGNMLGYDVWMAVGNGIFVMTGGRDSEEEATTLMRKAKLADFTIRADQETWFQQLGRRLPPGHHGLAQIDLMSLLGVPSIWWIDALDILPMRLGQSPDPDEADEQLEQFRELLKANKLSVVRSATGFKDGHWHWRLFW